MFALGALVAFIVAAILACTTRAARWWPVAACVGLALLTLAHGVTLD